MKIQEDLLKEMNQVLYAMELDDIYPSKFEDYSLLMRAFIEIKLLRSQVAILEGKQKIAENA